MAKLILFISLCLAYQSYAEEELRSEKCLKYETIPEESSACLKGDSYLHTYSALLDTPEPVKQCSGACERRFGAGQAEACVHGCGVSPAEQPETPSTEEGEGPWVLVLLRRFFYDKETDQVIERVSAIRFEIDPEQTPAGLPAETPRTPEQLIEDDRKQHSRVVSLRRYVTFDPLIPAVLLCMGLVSLFSVIYIALMVRHRRNAQGQKAANLAVAVQHEPIKLVLPEDLTKLSLIDDDEAEPLPNKLALPTSTV